MVDADLLVLLARGLDNQRKNKMRKELREKIGEVLRVPVKDREHLDCAESNEMFVILKSGSCLKRENFKDMRPLLRQALVAGCAALETYVADIAMEYVNSALRAADPPRRFRNIHMTIGDWLEHIQPLKNKGSGIRRIVQPYLRRTSSTAPSQIGVVLATVGVERWAKDVDNARGKEGGTTVRELDRITDRRNLIVHTGDRKGKGRASLTIEDVEKDIQIIKDVANAINVVMEDHKP